MDIRTVSRGVWAARILFLASAVAVPLCVHAEEVIKKQTEKQIAKVPSGPFRLEVKPKVDVVTVKNRFPALVTLLDANNQPIKATGPTKVEVRLVGPTGKEDDHWVTIPTGQSSAEATMEAEEAGLNQITAREEKDRLRGGKNLVLVVPQKKVVPKKKGENGAAGFRTSGIHRNGAALPAASQAGTRKAHLQWQVLCANADGCLADDRDPAHVQVFYVTESGSAAPATIRVWLRWNHGRLEPPNPVVIPQGQIRGEAWLRSRSPLEARVQLVESSPPLPVMESREQAVQFVSPIARALASGTERMSLVERGRVFLHFFDFEGRIVPVSVDRQVLFAPQTASLRVKPGETVVKKGQSFASAELMPGGVGPATLTVSTPYYPQVEWTVEVTWKVLLMMWSIGGLVGSVVALRSFKKLLSSSGVWRVITGLAAAALLSLLYVYFDVPQVDFEVAHSNLGILVTSLIGGFCGLLVFNWVAKKWFGQASPEAAE